VQYLTDVLTERRDVRWHGCDARWKHGDQEGINEVKEVECQSSLKHRIEHDPYWMLTEMQ
jgi:hypothetical protein